MEPLQMILDLSESMKDPVCGNSSEIMNEHRNCLHSYLNFGSNLFGGKIIEIRSYEIAKKPRLGEGKGMLMLCGPKRHLTATASVYRMMFYCYIGCTFPSHVSISYARPHQITCP